MSERQFFSETKRQRFRPYPEYKDSGVEWLGDIPAHWQTNRLKYVVTVSDERSYDLDSDLRFIGLEHIESGTGKLLKSTEDRAAESKEIESTSSIFKIGDVLFGKLRPYLAKVLRSDLEGRCSTELIVMRCGRDIDPQNLSYQLLSSGFISWINSMTYGTKMPRANVDQIKNTQLALPPMPEQQSIAAFLDRETAKIDALIAKKERLIELLQEKRTALITEAVTKGLDPNVPMKDSGVEWLGKIPAHWEVNMLKRIAFMRAGTAITSKEIESVGEYPVFGGNGIRGYTGSFTHDGAYPLVGRQGALCGCVNFALGKFWASEHAVVAAPNASVYARWLTNLLQAMSLNSYSQSAAQPGLAVETIGAIRAPLPGIDEQHAIAVFLGRETTKIDALLAKIRNVIDRLKELRAALVSAAVTGKIDVTEV